MKILLCLVFACWESFYRRWKGTASDKKWYNQKWFKTVANLCLTSCTLSLLGYRWWQVLVGTLVFQFLFWTQAIGGALDMGRDYPPSEETIKRYKSKFWNKWCEFLVPQKAWYGYFYDFLWMMFRYGLPAILVSIVLLNPFFLLAGVTCAMCYNLAWALYEHGEANPIVAEYLSGFFAGLLLTIGACL